MLAELDGCLAEALPRLTQVLRKVAGQRVFGCGPAVVYLALVNPLLAVMALVALHGEIVGDALRGGLA